MDILAELRRRSVFRIAAAYLVAGWIVMQVVDVIARASGLPNWTGSFALVLLVVGFPIALIIAWAFEITPEGPKRTGPRGEGEQLKPFRPADAIILAALVAVIGVVAWQQLAPREAQIVTVAVDEVIAEGPEAASIAVLAFDDLSPEGNQEYFSDGISEELLNVLVRVDGLRVASRTSAFQFKGRDIGIPEIAAELNVRHVVEGSVRRAGDTIRITAQLIDSENDGHLWSETYDRELTTSNIFAVQDEIASAIVASLGEELGTFLPDVEVEAATESLTAYELYLQARPLFLARDELGEAEGYLRRAVELDSEFSEAWEMRAAIHLLNSIGAASGISDMASSSPEESHVLAQDYADQALALDEDSSLAITVSTFLRYPFMPSVSMPRIDATMIRNGIDGFGRALEFDSHNATALNWRGIMYRHVGYGEEALADFARCIEIEPLYAPCHTNLVAAHAGLGDDDAAFRAAVAAWNVGATLFSDFGTLARLGRRELFLNQAADQYGPGAPWGEHGVLYEIFRNPEGDFDHLIPAIAAWAEEEGWRDVPFPAPDVLIGNYEAMPDFAFLIWQPELAPFRADSAFQDYLSRTPLPEFWRTYGFPPHCREESDGRIICD